MRFHSFPPPSTCRTVSQTLFWLTIQSIYGYFTESLFVTLYLHTPSFPKMRSIALMSLIFTLFALFFSALLYYSKVLYTLTIFPTFFCSCCVCCAVCSSRSDQ